MNKLILYSILFFCIVSSSYTQENLIYNGDFELFSSCPTNVTSPGDYQIEKCLGWSAPTYATSDYFNECASLYVGIPNNFFGNQSPKSGSAYTGFHGNSDPIFNSGMHWWEYLQDSLTQNLITNHEYTFKMYVSLGENQSGICSKNIGAYFSEQRVSNPNSSTPLNYPAQVKSSFFICDTIEWVEISGKFVADGGERYITLGHFADSNAFDTTFLKYSDGIYYPTTYYYVDDVSLVDLGEVKDSFFVEIPNIFTPNNDNANDLWIPKYHGVSSVDLIVINRWGNIVFQTNDQQQTWDGKSEGKYVNDGTYFYVIKFETNTKVNEQKSGFIQVINSK